MDVVNFLLGSLNPILLLRTFYLAAAALVNLPSNTTSNSPAALSITNSTTSSRFSSSTPSQPSAPASSPMAHEKLLPLNKPPNPPLHNPQIASSSSSTTSPPTACRTATSRTSTSSPFSVPSSGSTNSEHVAQRFNSSRNWPAPPAPLASPMVSLHVLGPLQRRLPKRPP
jgi:hypothetical protein